MKLQLESFFAGTNIKYWDSNWQSKKQNVLSHACIPKPNRLLRGVNSKGFRLKVNFEVRYNFEENWL